MGNGGRNSARAAGFTLLEVIAVLVIVSLLAVSVTQVFVKDDDQRRFDETRAFLEQVRSAILGGPASYANGRRQFGGYAADMGRLPPLVAVAWQEGTVEMPEELWEDPETASWQYQGDDSRIWCGWRGPYVECPAEGVLVDGWGNPFHFSADDPGPGDMTVKSCGADGEEDDPGDPDSGRGYDGDIELTVRKTQYKGALAGRVTGFADKAKVRIRAHFPEAGGEYYYQIGGAGMGDDGYFGFRRGVEVTNPDGEAVTLGENPLPAGLGSIRLWEDTDESGEWNEGEPRAGLVFVLGPTGNFLGDIEIRP